MPVMSRRRLQVLPTQIAQSRISLTICFGSPGASHAAMSDSFTYRDLEAWKQGMTLVEDCYRATVPFPANELYGLTSQIRRAAVSIPSNVAEGRCRHTTKVYANHVSIALGSLGELETCIELSTRLGLLKERQATRLMASAGSVGRLLTGLHQSLEQKLQQLAASTPSP